MGQRIKHNVPDVSIGHYQASGGVSWSGSMNEETKPQRYEAVNGTHRVQLAKWREGRGSGHTDVLVSIPIEDIPSYVAALMNIYVDEEEGTPL